MVFTGERYYISWAMLRLIGLSPYQKPIASRIIFLFYFVMYIFGIFSQTMRYVSITHNLMFTIKWLSLVLPGIACTINYSAFYFNIKMIKEAYEHIKLDWNIHTDRGEIEILTKYTYTSYILSLTTYISGSFFLVGFALLESTPIILDFFAPMNISRPRTLKIFYELFVDEERYFFLYVIFEILELMLGYSTAIVIGTVTFAIIMHICAEFKIASNLIHDLVTDRILQIPVSQRTHFIYQNIRRAVSIHRRIMKFFNSLLNTFHVWYFFIMLFGVASLSCNLIQSFNAIKDKQVEDTCDIFICFTISFLHILYAFMGNLGGQAIIDHSTEMLNATYNTLWYVAPLPIQKMLLFILRSARQQKLNIGGIFIASLEGFTTLMISTISYFTVLYSMMAKN